MNSNTKSMCKDTEIGKFKFVAKAKFLSQRAEPPRFDSPKNI